MLGPRGSYPTPRILSLGDQALTVEFGDRIDLAVNDQVLAYAAALERLRLSGIEEIVPTYRSITIYFDPLTLSSNELTAHLAELFAQPSQRAKRKGASHTIPVLYGGAAGPDLQDVATHADLTPEQVVDLHTSVQYRVYMLGFSPGFPYLGTVAEPLIMPRLSTPRKHVPAGSIGLAGAQTGIYPQDSPGGWRIIGRTPLELFSVTRKKPFLLQPGDRVKFVPIDVAEFDNLTRDLQ
ncbi:MAG: 5-oxoprolinase subunit PxpB [Nitrospiraceae bacterium]|nr:5-oxoprolinase subunit PxpB [Nitrospiraceae bacterium]